jgi:hypothetical protein
MVAIAAPSSLLQGVLNMAIKNTYGFRVEYNLSEKIRFMV